MPTECLFRDDSYLKDCAARVLAIGEQGGIVLDRTVFYATSGGQPGDSGTLSAADGTRIAIATAVYTDAAKSEIAHVPEAGAPALKVGDQVTAAIDWDRRYARMRMHTAMHLSVRRAALRGHRRLGRRSREPARLRYSGGRARQGRGHGTRQRDDRQQRGRHQPLDQPMTSSPPIPVWSRPCR